MDRSFFLALAFGAMLLAPLANAAGSLPPFSFVDEDGDRNISRSEARAEQALAGVFDQLDSNRDGHLTRLEYLGASFQRSRAASPSGLDQSRPAEPVLTGNILP